jgi:hypothetical protein
MNLVIEYVTGLSMAAGPSGAGLQSASVFVHTAIDVKGLAAFQPGSDTEPNALSAQDWNEVDRLVQESFTRLTTPLLAREPRVVWKTGRTENRACPLFSYCVFYHLDGDDYDPVVIGVAFKTHDSQVRVTGDISGDESGFVYYDEGCTIDAPAQPIAVRDAARAVADRLAAQAAIVLEAIRNRHPRAQCR